MPRGKKSEPESPILPPMDFAPPSNGEFCPRPPGPLAQQRWRLWRAIVEEKHQRLGMTRRAFAESACGTAAWLFVMNQVACKGGGGEGAPADGGGDLLDPSEVSVGGDVSGFEVESDMLEDVARAGERLQPAPFVLDAQTHISFNEITPWAPAGPPERVVDFLKRIFVASDTTVACVSGVPSTRMLGAANVAARDHLSALVDRLAGPRLLFHCNADPQLPGEPDYMAEVAARHKGIAAWKVYPHDNPARGLDHDDFAPFLDRARTLGIGRIAAHRGISDGGNYDAAGSPRDVVLAAAENPDLKFLVYHSGWESTQDENHAYDPNAPETALRGVDRFIRALKKHNISADGNVYAELGTTWANLIMTSSDAAAHVLGKLLQQLGPERILWGTDCVFNDGPKGQIDAFLAFTIAERLQMQFGYPALTLADKHKILGLNGAALYGIDVRATRYALTSDEVSRLRAQLRQDPRSVPMPHPRRFTGPRTRREFLAFLRAERARSG
jgi:predicted TIM-barrel fold metal-dependent hydrolase